MKATCAHISIVFLAIFLIACSSNPSKTLETQNTTKKPADAKSKRPSPLMVTSARIDETIFSITYSSPSVKNREIWGALVPFGEVWRTGANEAVVFETNLDININGQALPAGKYALFTIPNKDNWTVIFNSEYAPWGAYDYDSSKAVLRIEVVPSRTDELQEMMRFDMMADGTTHFSWEFVKWSFKIDVVTK